MNRFIKYILLSCLPFMASAQHFNFTEVWVWEYGDEAGAKKEMAVYREPALNYWLLTPEAFGNTDEASEWFILKPDGEVIQAYQDAEMNSGKKIIRHHVYAKVNSDIPAYWKKGKSSKFFGSVNLGFEKMEGLEYNVTYTKSNDKSTFYLAKVKADFTSLAHFNTLPIDAKLPIRFPTDIPKEYVILSEYTTFSGGCVQYHFKYISQTEYHINQADYEQ